MPAGVGEDTSGQKDTKSTIDKAIRAASTGDDWGPGKSISKARPESILNVGGDAALVAFSRFLHGGSG